MAAPGKPPEPFRERRERPLERGVVEAGQLVRAGAEADFHPPAGGGLRDSALPGEQEGVTQRDVEHVDREPNVLRDTGHGGQKRGRVPGGKARWCGANVVEAGDDREALLPGSAPPRRRAPRRASLTVPV